MRLRETQFAKSGDLHIAFQVVGEGRINFALLTRWLSKVDAQWNVPQIAQLRSHGSR